VRPVVSGVRVEVVNVAIGRPAVGLTVIVPVEIEAHAVTGPAAAGHSRWLQKSSWRN
jgi:hypothetical protein